MEVDGGRGGRMLEQRGMRRSSLKKQQRSIVGKGSHNLGLMQVMLDIVRHVHVDPNSQVVQSVDYCMHNNIQFICIESIQAGTTPPSSLRSPASAMRSVALSFLQCNP